MNALCDKHFSTWLPLRDKNTFEALRESFFYSGNTILQSKHKSLADGIPIVGHIKGGIHYALGDEAKGAQSMKSASRTVGVIGGGVGGFFVGGPAGSVAGGIAGGAAVDGIVTGIDSAVAQ